MALTSPVIEWRDSTTPFPVLSSLPLIGTGFNGAILVGTISQPTTLLLYNNFSAAAGVADATSCTIACYDDVIHQGIGVTPPTSGHYLQVQVLDYNGNPLSGDQNFYGIGGSTKHRIPVNSGVISGNGANYVTVVFQVSIPSNATQGTVSQGVWLEYSSTV